MVTSASLRMVVDLSDDEKIPAVLPGGVSGRIFHPRAKDQVKSFINGGKVYWWFSDKAIQEHKKGLCRSDRDEGWDAGRNRRKKAYRGRT